MAAAGQPQREEITSVDFLPPSWRRLTSSGWLISNRSSLLLFHCWMTLASFSRSSSSGIVFSHRSHSVSLYDCCGGKRLSYPSRVDASAGPHPYFSVHPSSSKLIKIIAHSILTSLRAPSPASLCPHFTGQLVLVMWSKQFPNHTSVTSKTLVVKIQSFSFVVLIVSMR